MLHPGEEFSGLIVEGLLGEGAHCAVFRVRDPEEGRHYALKLASIDNIAAAARIRREAQLHAMVVHPNVVPFVRLVSVGDKIGILLRLIEGPTLSTLLRRGPIASVLVAPLGSAIIDAVAAVHRMGLLHRDIKPSNVLMFGPNSSWTPMLSDFGLATTPDDAGRAARAALYGTPSYMAPEIVRDSRSVDQRADIFSLGALLYELACGRAAFDPASETLFLDMSRGRFDRPSKHTSLPRNVEEAIVGCLQPDLRWRIPDIDTLASLWRGEQPRFAYSLPPGALRDRSTSSGAYRPSDATIIPDDDGVEPAPFLGPSRPQVDLEVDDEPPTVATAPAAAPELPPRPAAPARTRFWSAAALLTLLVGAGATWGSQQRGWTDPAASQPRPAAPEGAETARAMIATPEPAVVPPEAGTATAEVEASPASPPTEPDVSVTAPLQPVTPATTPPEPGRGSPPVAPPPIAASAAGAIGSMVSPTALLTPAPVAETPPAPVATPGEAAASTAATTAPAPAAPKGSLDDLAVDVGGGFIRVHGRLSGSSSRALHYEMSEPGGRESYVVRLPGISNELGIRRFPVASPTVREVTVDASGDSLVVTLHGGGVLAPASFSQDGDSFDIRIATSPSPEAKP